MDKAGTSKRRDYGEETLWIQGSWNISGRPRQVGSREEQGRGQRILAHLSATWIPDAKIACFRCE